MLISVQSLAADEEIDEDIIMRLCEFGYPSPQYCNFLFECMVSRAGNLTTCADSICRMLW